MLTLKDLEDHAFDSQIEKGESYSNFRPQR